MRNLVTGLIVTIVGVGIAKIGQGFAPVQFDGIWAFIAVFSILMGIVTAAANPVSRALARIR
jgi:hypothetical protein